MSAPHRSTGRLVPRAPAPATGNATAPAQTRGRSPQTFDEPASGGMEPASSGLEPASGGMQAVELAGLLHELSVHLLGADDLPGALSRLADFGRRSVPGTLRCSVVLIADGEPLTHAAAGRTGQAFDDLQYATGDGPGLEASRTRALVTAQDLPADPRWPHLADCARECGVQAVASIPLEVQRSSVGALSLFLARPHSVDPGLLLTAMAIVGQAEVLLGEVQRRAGLREGATVDQAIGVIIAQRGCGVQEAYDVLRDTAQRLGMDRRLVAERLVAAAAARNQAP
jgi:ANTAR domain/GAF domain